MRKKALSLILAGTMIISYVTSAGATNATSVGGTFNKKTGVITLKGKGPMPRTLNYRNNKRVKKVIIKNGVTTINLKAFYKCKNLKKIKIGKKVKKIGRFAFYQSSIKNLIIPKNVGVGAFCTKKAINKVKMPGKIKSKTIVDYEKPLVVSDANIIEFTSALDLNTVLLVNAGNYKVSSRDSKYSSADGVIYTKDGKTSVRLPNREKVVISNKCEEFDVFSYMYAYFYGDDFYEFKCDRVKEIVLPESIVKISDSSTPMYEYSAYIKKSNLERIEVKNPEIDDESLEKLKTIFHGGCDVEKSEKSIVLTKKK